MILIVALARHRPALSASLRAEYGIRLSAVLEGRERERWDEVMDLVAFLPPASALWMSIGGPASITPEMEQLRWIDYRLRVLDWRKTKDKTPPETPKKIPYAHERDAEAARMAAKSTAWHKRQEMRARQAAAQT